MTTEEVLRLTKRVHILELEMKFYKGLLTTITSCVIDNVTMSPQTKLNLALKIAEGMKEAIESCIKDES